MTLLITFLSLALAIASLLVMHERRQRRGLQSLLDRVLHRESFLHDELRDSELYPNRRRSKTAAAGGGHAGRGSSDRRMSI